MTAYQLRPVEAVQWMGNPESDAAICALAGAFWRSDDEGRLIDVYGRRQRVYRGDYVAKLGDEVWVYRPAAFEALYEPVARYGS